MTQERANESVVGDNSGDSDGYKVKDGQRKIIQEMLNIVESRIACTRGQLQFDKVTDNKKAIPFEEGELEAYVDVATLLSSWKEQI